MAAKNRKELKENELAGALGERIEQIKPHLPMILLGFVALSGIVFGINYFLASRSAAKEAKSISMILYAVEQSSAGSLSTLDKQIEDFPDDSSAAWAYLLKADSQLSQGLDSVFVDKSGAMERIKSSLKNFEEAFSRSSDDEMLRLRSLYGWACALESLGDFDLASEKYQKIVDDAADSSFADLAKIGLDRVSDESNREFYEVFAKKENNVFNDPGSSTGGVAPTTNTGLPARPDFTYPGEEVVPGTESGASSFPSGNSLKTGDDKKAGPVDQPPAPPKNVLDGDKKVEAPKKDSSESAFEPAKKADEKAAPVDKAAKDKADAPASTDSKKAAQDPTESDKTKK